MANRTVFTDFFRAGYVHLAEPHKMAEKQDPAYSIRLMFPKTGVTPNHLANGAGGGQPANCGSIVQALEDVCMEHFKCSFADAPAAYGIQFPPKFIDGDTDWKKDENGRILQGQPKEASVGNWMINVKSKDPVGVCDASKPPINIDPSMVYSGCWCRAELDVSAYTNKSNQHIIAVSLVSVQMVYADESLGGGRSNLPASTSWADKGVDGSDVQAPAPMPGQVANAAPPAPNATPAPAAAPAVPTPNAAPAAPAVPTPAAPADTLTPVAGSQYTIEQLRAANWTDEQIVAGGYATKSAPAAPAVPTPQATPAVPTPAPGQNYMTPPAAAPAAAPPPAAAPAVPTPPMP